MGQELWQNGNQERRRFDLTHLLGVVKREYTAKCGMYRQSR